MATRMFCDGCGREIDLPVRSASRDLVLEGVTAPDADRSSYVVLMLGRAKLDLCAVNEAEGTLACLTRVLDALRTALPCMPASWGEPRSR